MFITEPWMLCTDDMCRMDVYIWGKEKILCSNKMCEKKIYFCLVWGFSNHSSNQGGVNWLGFILIFLLIHFIEILNWIYVRCRCSELNHGCCAQMTCAGWMYIFGRG